MTRHFFRAIGAASAFLGLNFLGVINVSQWGAIAQQIVSVLGILTLGIPGSLALWDAYVISRRKNKDDANKLLWETKAKEAEEKADKAVKESLANQETMNRKLDSIQKDLQFQTLQNRNLNQQLLEATNQHIQASMNLRSADARIVELTAEIERLRLGEMRVIGAKVDKVDRHVKQVAKAMNESDTMPSVEMDSDLDGENAGGPVTGAN